MFITYNAFTVWHHDISSVIETIVGKNIALRLERTRSKYSTVRLVSSYDFKNGMAVVRTVVTPCNLTTVGDSTTVVSYQTGTFFDFYCMRRAGNKRVIATKREYMHKSNWPNMAAI